MNHLPLSCEFQFAELDLKSILPEEIIEQFKGEIDKRHHRRVEIQKREEHERKNLPTLGNTFHTRAIPQDKANFPACSPEHNYIISSHVDSQVGDDDEEEETEDDYSEEHYLSKPSYASLFSSGSSPQPLPGSLAEKLKQNKTTQAPLFGLSNSSQKTKQTKKGKKQALTVLTSNNHRKTK